MTTDRRILIAAVLDLYRGDALDRETAVASLMRIDEAIPAPPGPAAEPVAVPLPLPTAQNGWQGLDGLRRTELRRLASTATGHSGAYIQARWGTSGETLRRLIRGLPVRDRAEWDERLPIELPPGPPRHLTSAV